MLLLRRIGVVSAISAVIAIGGGCGPSGAILASPVRPSHDGVTATQAPLAVSPATDAATLATAMRERLREFGGTTGVFIAIPGRPEPLYAAGADTPFVAASLYKLAVLLRVESLVQRGTLSYDDTITIEEVDVTQDGSNEFPGTTLTIDRALEEMITYSDNGAALALVRVYGAAATDATLAAAGITGFHIAESDDEDNVATARALGTFFDLLATRRLVSAEASDRMLARLERQQINDRLPRDLPADVAVAHKTGDLGGLIHDAGLIQTSDGPRIAVVLTSGGTEATAKDLIAGVGAIVYSAVLPAVAGARAAALPPLSHDRPAAVSRAGTGATPAVAAIAILMLLVLGGLVLVRRSGRRRHARGPRRRGSGPMAVWSPDRSTTRQRSR
ncbi:MAG: class A beta-lactamase-related serine hydrolase [Chloroflexota bacterium]|nr:class A beta-lactamase-related serine hydrolase [Chloroflexota bacterium]